MKINLIIYDPTTGKKWKSPKHKKGKKDDYHKETKPVLIQDLAKKLKEKFGNNPDFQIIDDKIVAVFKKPDKEGKSRKVSIVTELQPEHYFDEVLHLLMTYFITKNSFKSIRITKFKYGLRVIIRLKK